MTKGYELNQHLSDTISWWNSLVGELEAGGRVVVGDQRLPYPNVLRNKDEPAANLRVTIREMPDHIRFILLSSGPDQSYGLRSGSSNRAMRAAITENVKRLLRI